MVENREVVLTASSQEAVFLQPIQMIYWNEQTKAIAQARELTKDRKTDREKVAAIYNYIIQNVQYDYEKAKVVTSEYIPSVDATLQVGQGICYDYAALFAAMLRSEGIPTKLVMGKKNDIQQYHAWNEIYFKDTNEWVTIDTTYDSIMSKGTKKPTMIKNKSEYITEKQF
ncbi:transglutaminase-like domain-containing protein [Brevibacillus panacihumi]|nr:transglutaminase-like domain-containing protein [Brevibacillus panacihumi]